MKIVALIKSRVRQALKYAAIAVAIATALRLAATYVFGGTAGVLLALAVEAVAILDEFPDFFKPIF